jgi:hypothetical protein
MVFPSRPKALTIRQRLIRRDPTNSEWEGNLARNYTDLGDVLKAKGEQNPSNSNWQYESAAIRRHLGVILRAQGDLLGAQQALQASRDILTNLLQLHGDNPTWKADLDSVKKELGE